MLTADEKKYCPGLIHLRAQLRALIAAEGAAMITIDDGEDPELQVFAADEAGLIAASEYAPELDGILIYQVGDAVLQVIYDGPYGEHNAAEIVADCNERAGEILDVG